MQIGRCPNGPFHFLEDWIGTDCWRKLFPGEQARIPISLPCSYIYAFLLCLSPQILSSPAFKKQIESNKCMIKSVVQNISSCWQKNNLSGHRQQRNIEGLRKLNPNAQMIMWPTHIFLSSFAPVWTVVESCFPGHLLILCAEKLNNWLKLHHRWHLFQWTEEIFYNQVLVDSIKALFLQLQSTIFSFFSPSLQPSAFLLHWAAVSGNYSYYKCIILSLSKLTNSL